MKKFLSVIAVVLSLALISGCGLYVSKLPAEGVPNDVKEEKANDKITEEKEETIKPVVVQKISQQEAKEKVSKKYGGEGVIVKLSGEYEIDDKTYYVFDLGADIDGMFSKDFSVVLDAQSGESFEGRYDKETGKIIKY